jgi:hypothetical protein
MLIRVALLAVTALAVSAPAQAQSPFPPVGQQASPFPPVGGQPASPFPPVNQGSPFPPAGGQASPFPPAGAGTQAQKPPCFDEFTPLRQEVENRFKPTQAALTKLGGLKPDSPNRRAAIAEVCRAVTRFNDAERKMIKFVEQNGSRCSIPAQVLQNMKAGHEKTTEIRAKACATANAPQRPARPPAPTLSDALTTPAPSASNTRTGRGTLDTLSGNALAR